MKIEFPLWFKRVFIYCGLGFVIFLFIDALTTPMIQTSWGFTNYKLDTITMIMIGILTVWNFFRINTLQRKLNNIIPEMSKPINKNNQTQE